MHLRAFNLSMPARITIGATIIAIYVLAVIYAMFPNTEFGKFRKESFFVFGGISIAVFLICLVLHFFEQVIRSVRHWKQYRHDPGEPFLLGDKSVVVFSGWLEFGFAMVMSFMACGFLGRYIGIRRLFGVIRESRPHPECRTNAIEAPLL